MDETSSPQYQRSTLNVGILHPSPSPVFVGGIVTLIAIWALIGIREYADFEALQWWVYINYDFVPRVNPFTIGPFLAGMIGGYMAGYLTSGLYENAIANAVKANLLGGVFLYITIVVHSIGSLLRSGMIDGDVLLVLIVQPLLFIAIPFTLVFMAEGVIAGPVGKFVRRKLSNQHPRLSEQEDEPGNAYSIRAMIRSFAIILVTTVTTWSILYSFYLFLTP